MNTNEDFIVAIEQLEKSIGDVCKTKELWNDNDLVLKLFNEYYNCIYSQVHVVLAPQRTDESESQLREILRKYVIGYKDKKKLYMGAISILEYKIAQISQRKPVNESVLIKYHEIYDSFYALASFRSLKHFVMYMEWDLPANDRIFTLTQNCFDGYWFYANQAILDYKWKKIFMQAPTGYGKCILETENVSTPNGYKMIKDINIGDSVLSMLENKVVERTVTNKWNTVKKQVKITTRGGKQIIVSPEHRLYTQRGYIEAKDLRESDYLFRLCSKVNGENEIDDFVWEKIKCIEALDDYAKMVDIEVEETHNFICNGVVSHNSYGQNSIIAWILGVDIHADILKVTGNPANLGANSTKLIKYMCKPAYAKVFPYYGQFRCKREEMFEICQVGGVNSPTRLLVKGSKSGESLLFVNKETPIDGTRYKYKLYDDVTRSSDAGSITRHEKDVEKYDSEWERRKYDDFRSCEFFAGTAYHIDDFISVMKRRNGGEIVEKAKVNKYTKINKETRAAFISVPKLDPDTDKITFPAKYSEEEAKKKRAENPDEFYAMDQQEPMPIEGCPFDYKKLLLYNVIPHQNKEDEVCYAVLDPARTGANFVTMLIYIKIDGKFYLKDCIYEMRPMEELHNEIVEKIIRHKIVKFHVERNTDTSLKTLLDEMLASRGYLSCDISEVYSSKNKKDKISEMEASIRNNMVFPRFGLYAGGSPMGKLMKWFTGYSYLSKNKFDDAPDAAAMFAKKFIVGGGIKYATIGSFRR